MASYDGPVFQNRIVVVLVRARNPANIGAVARAMHDLGFAQLRIVNDFSVPFAAAKSAVDASSVLLAAIEASSVAAAIADCTLVLGTTAVGDRALEHPLHHLAEASVLVRTALKTDPQAKVALLFGSEKTGLSNEELSHCHALLTIPMNSPETGRHLSMNLGQAVAVCLYALSSARPSPTSAQSEPIPASVGDHERLTSLLRDVLDASGYTRRNPASARELPIRRLVRRMHLSTIDAPVWTGILRQILFRLRRLENTSHPHDSSNQDAPADQDHGEQVS